VKARGASSATRAALAHARELGGLAGRELEVLVLLAGGLRNAQIAERLVVAERTIDHHVAAILRKLDVRTRREASAAAARLGLTEPT
jgi:DNA-binding NarL/FixJ family response regulator